MLLSAVYDRKGWRFWEWRGLKESLRPLCGLVTVLEDADAETAVGPLQ